MMRLLLWLQWRQWRHLQVGRRELAVGLFVALCGLVMLAGLGLAAVALALAEPLATLGKVTALAFVALVALLIVVGVPRIFTLLYTARDVELLFTLPIPTRGVFLLKFAQSVVEVGGLALLAVSVPLLCYGVAAGANWLYYPIALLVLGSLVVGALALCHLTDLLLVRLLPARRVKGFMTALSALVGLLGVLSSQFMGRASERVSAHGLAGLPSPPGWLPTSWAATALTQAARGEAGSLLNAGAVALVALGLAGLALLLVERGFRLGWVRLSEDGSRRRGRRQRATTATPTLPSPLIAIGLKELRLLRRDAREWMRFAPFLVIGVVTLYRTAAGSHDASEAEGVWLLLQAELVGGFAFFGANFAAPAISREREAFWVLRSAPLSGWQVLLGKFWVYWLAPLVGALLLDLAGAVYFSWRWSWILFGCVGLAGISAGAIALGLCVGAYGARFNPERPSQPLRIDITLLQLGLSAAYIIAAALPVGLAVALADSALTRALSLLWLVAFGVGTAAITLRLAAARYDAGIDFGGQATA
jgi:ABC-2 type transport system permease protein